MIAPEFDEIIVDDTSTASNYLDATINLIKHLKTKLPIDGKRLYTTGQSGGGMMSIALRLRFRQRTTTVVSKVTGSLTIQVLFDRLPINHLIQLQ